MVQESQTPPTEALVPKGAFVLLRSIHPVNLLSFGPGTVEIPLGPLNVIVGANGSGKSNLVEVVCLLRSTARSIEDFFRANGGFSEWQFKELRSSGKSYLSSLVSPDNGRFLYSHRFALLGSNSYYELESEDIKKVSKIFGNEVLEVVLKYEPDNPFVDGLVVKGNVIEDQEGYELDLKESLLSQLRGPDIYREMAMISLSYEQIRAYRDWSFGRNTVFRTPQRADMRNEHLEEDFSNLGLFLNKLRRNPQAKNAILTRLRDLYEGVDDYDVSIEGGTVQVFLTEGNITVPATRLSDGTLRYLCLLAILCDPTPPPLICLEEPELGLHPDILPKIADLLVEASTRTQLIVTTHSEIIIDALTDRPECVLVCEKHEGQTRIERLSREDLSEWLTKYRLGELWMRGEIGGKRW